MGTFKPTTFLVGTLFKETISKYKKMNSQINASQKDKPHASEKIGPRMCSGWLMASLTSMKII